MRYFYKGKPQTASAFCGLRFDPPPFLVVCWLNLGVLNWLVFWLLSLKKGWGVIIVGSSAHPVSGKLGFGICYIHLCIVRRIVGLHRFAKLFLQYWCAYVSQWIHAISGTANRKCYFCIIGNRICDLRFVSSVFLHTAASEAPGSRGLRQHVFMLVYVSIWHELIFYVSVFLSLFRQCDIASLMGSIEML